MDASYYKYYGLQGLSKGAGFTLCLGDMTISFSFEHKTLNVNKKINRNQMLCNERWFFGLSRLYPKSLTSSGN